MNNTTQIHPIQPQRKWTMSERQFLIDNYNRMVLSTLSVLLGRTPFSVRSKAQALALQESQWSEYEIDYLKDHYANTTAKEIATHLQRPVASVFYKARFLNLRKPRTRKGNK